jgi:16S rRNA G966 N2-methylase RsmD
LIAALTGTAATIGIAGLEGHVADALRYLRTERRAFDVIFLDPPFADDPWHALFAALAPVIGESSLIYAEASRPIVPPAALDVVRQARAGGVHYHLLARNALAANR